MKHKQYSYLFLLVIGVIIALTTPVRAQSYTVPPTPWQEKLGNHRAIIAIDKTCEVAELNFEWRRPDNEVSNRMFLIVDAETGDTIQNIRRVLVNNDVCKLQFGPVKKQGTYYFYYLPYEVQTGHGFYGKGYYPQESKPDANWLQSVAKVKNIPAAAVVEIQSRTTFDSFFPMEIAATEAELNSYREENDSEFYLFPEGRENPIRMRYKIPIKWLSVLPGTAFKATAQPNEYFAFQVGVWTPKRKLSGIKYAFSDLRNGSTVIPSKNMTCFNTEGVDPYGISFTKEIDIEAGKVQPLWFGIDISPNQPQGTYKGVVEIWDSNEKKQAIPVEITVAGSTLADRGDSEPWRHSRLRWLNSTLGISDAPTKPYTNIVYNKNRISVSGREIELNPLSGFPQQINVSAKPVLSRPIRFIIETDDGIIEIPSKLTETKKTDGSVALKWKGESDDLTIETNTVTEFDGWNNYAYKIIPKRSLKVKDIRLEIAMNKDDAQYFMGAGLPGQATPNRFEGKWDTPEMQVNEMGVSIPVSKKMNWLWPFDSFWMGSAHAGLHVELNGTTYSGPLLNLYRPSYPKSWNNEGKGGFLLTKDKNSVEMLVYSGSRTLEAGTPITFEFSMIITPVKEINYKSQFADRYYHNGGQPVPTDKDVKAGVKIINVHHANELNPVINYPFLTVGKMKDFTSKWHAKGCKVKLYYTIRELTNAVTEIWAIRSLGNEILRSGDKTMGGYPWLREHFVTDYTPQWYHHFKDVNELGITADASVLTATGDSRWYNYYIEGLAWLVKNLDIDGIYLDDVAYDRRILKRMRRAMDSVKEGCSIDLHSNTGFSRGPATQYTEYFPYVDKLWFGESFMYDRMSPENWLIEVSGIPFGLMGDMLHGGGNRWLGMQYGMTVRLPWTSEGITIDPRPIWKIWDEFDIANAKMVGFWESNPPVTSDNPNVKITSYLKNDTTLISIGNYSDKTQQVQLKIDRKQFGVSNQNVKLVAPEIEDFQSAQTFSPSSKIQVKARKGLLLYLIHK